MSGLSKEPLTWGDMRLWALSVSATVLIAMYGLSRKMDRQSSEASAQQLKEIRELKADIATVSGDWIDRKTGKPYDQRTFYVDGREYTYILKGKP